MSVRKDQPLLGFLQASYRVSCPQKARKRASMLCLREQPVTLPSLNVFRKELAIGLLVHDDGHAAAEWKVRED